MPDDINHALKVDHSRDELARQHFVSGMRAYVLNDLAGELRSVYQQKVEPSFERSQGRKPKDGPEVHKAIRGETMFKFYSALRCNTQAMCFRSVMPAVGREAEDLIARAEKLDRSNSGVRGTVAVDPDLSIPRYVSSLDVHLMAGNYHEEHRPGDMSQGAVYENGLSVFAMGLLGPNMDDITQSVSTFFATRHPDFKPKKILDLGCTVGHSTLAWKDRYPDAEVHAVDVGAPCVRYGHARAQALGVEAHFHQKDAEFTGFADESFDVIYSCMFLHEVPGKNIRAIMKEARRMLKPGGVMIHYELPPNKIMSAYDSFYLDWDSFYNKEPFYKAFRDMDPAEECESAGFARDRFFNFTVPSLNFYGKEAVERAVSESMAGSAELVGRMVDGVRWYTFGGVEELTPMLSGKASKSAPTKLRDTVKGKQLKFFDAQGVDELVSISLQLAQELWVVKERLATVEAAAAKKGVALADEVEGFSFTAEQRATLEAEKKAFIDRVFFTLREQAEALEKDAEAEPAGPAMP